MWYIHFYILGFFFKLLIHVTFPSWLLFPSGFASAAAAMRPPTAEMLGHRNAVFSREQARQKALYPRIEKIEVSMHGPGLDGTLLIMNKGMSTPLSCARREWRDRGGGKVALSFPASRLQMNKCIPFFFSPSRSDGVSCQQLSPGSGGWGIVAPAPAPHSLLLTLSAHI